ncbi:MAG TPA: hypothetical protein VED16_04340 [Candidatus Acidoferrum sp.]|nr:hypothetical protein [Candidatus Acidoferrum sp.]
MLWELCLFLLTPPVVPLILIPGVILPLGLLALALVGLVITNPTVLTSALSFL